MVGLAGWSADCSASDSPCETAGEWATAVLSAEPDREMKVTILLGAVALLALLAFAAAPVALASAATIAGVHVSRAEELVWMLVSGATLLGVARAVRRFVP